MIYDVNYTHKKYGQRLTTSSMKMDCPASLSMDELTITAKAGLPFTVLGDLVSLSVVPSLTFEELEAEFKSANKNAQALGKTNLFTLKKRLRNKEVNLETVLLYLMGAKT